MGSFHDSAIAHLDHEPSGILSDRACAERPGAASRSAHDEAGDSDACCAFSPLRLVLSHTAAVRFMERRPGWEPASPTANSRLPESSSFAHGRKNHARVNS
jgi:hypothetical protein